MIDWNFSSIFSDCVLMFLAYLLIILGVLRPFLSNIIAMIINSIMLICSKETQIPIRTSFP